MRIKPALVATAAAIAFAVAGCSSAAPAATTTTTTAAAAAAAATPSMSAEPMSNEPMSGESMSGESMSGESMSGESAAAAAGRRGSFAGLNGKSVAGTVTIAGDTLTLSGFSSDEGPDLHLYLANGTDEAAVAAGIELGTVAWNQAGQTFHLTGSAGYTDVVVHCDKAGATFGAATLS